MRLTRKNTLTTCIKVVMYQGCDTGLSPRYEYNRLTFTGYVLIIKNTFPDRVTSDPLIIIVVYFGETDIHSAVFPIHYNSAIV